MRYRDGDVLGEPASSTDEMLIITAVIGLLIGLVLSVAGIRGRQIWLAFWSITLVLGSLAYMGARMLGYR